MVFKKLSLEFNDVKFILKTYAMPREEEIKIKEDINSENFILINEDYSKNEILTLMKKVKYILVPIDLVWKNYCRGNGFRFFSSGKQLFRKLRFYELEILYLLKEYVEIKKYEYTSLSNGAYWT